LLIRQVITISTFLYKASTLVNAAYQVKKMPSVPVPTGQDWGTVNVGRSALTTKVTLPKTARELDQLKAAGKVVTEKKCV